MAHDNTHIPNSFLWIALPKTSEVNFNYIAPISIFHPTGNPANATWFGK